MKTLRVADRRAWRTWLAKNHASEREIWLVYSKRDAPSPTYEESVEEALCFGWVDSLIRRIDDAEYARKFTPRTAESAWSTSNRRRYETMKSAGRLTRFAQAPTGRSGDAPRPASVPPYIERALRADPAVWAAFERLAPSHRRQYVAWIDDAKKDETKQRRLAEALVRLKAGETLGMK